jgi:hypothetical protein
MEASEARKKIDALLDDTFSAITPPLKWYDGWYSVTENTAGLNDRPDGTATLSADRYVRTKVSQTKFRTLLDMVQRHWKQLGYTDIDVNPDPQMPWMAVDTPDGYGITVQIGAAGNITISAGFSHIKDPENPYPFGYGPRLPVNAKGDTDLVPHLDDSFWSH